MFYSSCNIYVNKGEHKDEPLGTATAMHDCEGCSRFNYCRLKQTEPTFEYDKKKFELLWKATNSLQ